MGAKRCNEDLEEVLCDLAHAIRDQTKAAQVQLEWFQSHLNCVTLAQLQIELDKLQVKIMSQLSDFSDRVDAAFETIGTSVDGVVASVAGIDADVQSLKKQITDLQNSTGAITPEDQARLDKIEVTASALSTKTTALAASAKALDDATEAPPVV